MTDDIQHQEFSIVQDFGISPSGKYQAVRIMIGSQRASGLFGIPVELYEQLRDLSQPMSGMINRSTLLATGYYIITPDAEFLNTHTRPDVEGRCRAAYWHSIGYGTGWAHD